MSSSKPADSFFAAGGGIEIRDESGGDPFEALDDLMVVVEALCRTWPPRDTFENATQLLL